MSSNIKTKWKRLFNGRWFQKIFASASGIPEITYHYNSKTSEPCKVFEIDNKISRQLGGYKLIEKDLRDTLLLLEEYLKIKNMQDLYFSNNILLKSLTKAIIITYGKCFAKPEGRKIKLSNKIISSEYKQVHINLMEMRHQYVAHGGKSQYESCKLVFLLPPEKKYRKGKNVQPLTCDELYQAASLHYTYEEIKLLIEHLHKFVKNKILELKELIEKDIDNIDPEKLYKFSKNKRNRSVLNEFELNKLKHTIL